MKKSILFICTLLLVVSCKKNIDNTPVYKDFKNQLEELNFYGNVKKVVMKKAYPIAKSNNKFGDSKVNAIYTFNKAGNYEKTETFSDFEKLEASGEYFYNAQNLLEEFKMMSFHGNESEVLHEVNRFNADSLLSYKKIIYGDSLEYEFFMEYDTNGYAIQTTEFNNKDTIIIKSKNIYDVENRIIKTSTTQNNQPETNIQTYKYDTAGNLVLHKADFDGLKIKNENIFRDAILFKSNEYTIFSNAKEVVNQVIEYDHYYNPVKLTEFEDAKITKILKNEYEFDQQGNWIKRTIYINNNPSESDTFEPYLVETREISYW